MSAAKRLLAWLGAGLVCTALATTPASARADAAEASAGGEAAAARADLAAAASGFEAVYQELAAELGPQHERTITALDAAAKAYARAGNYSQQRLLDEQLLKVRTLVLGVKHPETLAAMNDLGAAFYGLAEYGPSARLYEEVLRLRREVLGERDRATLDSMGGLATAYWGLGRYAEQLALYEQMLPLRIEVLGPMHADTLKTLSNLAVAYAVLGRYPERLAVLEKLVESRRLALGERHPDTVQSMAALGRTLNSVGRSAEGLALNEKAVGLLTEVLGPSHPDTGVSMDGLAINYMALGRFEEAKGIFEALLRMDIETRGERHPTTLVAMNNLAGGYHGLGMIREEVSLNERLLDLRTATLGPRHPDTLVTMSNLGAGYRLLGRNNEALDLLTKSLALETEVRGERHPGTLMTLSHLARVYSALGRHAEALPLAERTLALHSEVVGAQHPETLRRIAELADEYARTDRPADAVALADRYVEGAERQRGQAGLSGENQRAIFRAYSEGYRRFSVYSGGTNDPRRGFRLAELSKARTLLDSMTAQRAGRSGTLPAASQAELESLDRQIGAYEQLLARARSPAARLTLEAARNELVRTHDALEAQLKRLYPKYAQLRVPPLLESTDLRGVIPEDAVAISYVVLEDDSVAAWLIEAAGEPKFVSLGRLPHLAEAVEAFRRGSANPRGLAGVLEEDAQRAWQLPDASFRWLDIGAAPPEGAAPVASEAEVASYLSGRLLDPLAFLLRKKAKWIVSPDGALAQLPFELLSIDGKRALETVEIHYAQSLSVYALARARQREYRSIHRPMDLLAMGDPDYGASSQAVGRVRARLSAFAGNAAEPGARSLAWPALPGSSIEIAAIRQLLPKSDIYLHAEASEARLQALNRRGDLARYRILHFAVHGDLSTGDPALSSLVLSQNQPAEGTDGYVTAAEWPGYDLRSDMTVLSACDTGLGRNLSGEGVMGLPFALFLAGNVNTVLSLWPVLDTAAPPFMQKFYSRLKAGESAAAALSGTKREMAADPRTSHPANWAPFILVGAG